MNQAALPPLTLGTWAFAKDEAWGPQEDALSIRTVHAALECGLNAFDSAPAYGQGESERVLGIALKGRRDQAFLATKVSRQDLHHKGVIASCENSLNRLGTDYIDLLQVHWPNHDGPPGETIEALESLQAASKIRAYGVCNFGRKDLQSWREAGAHIAFNQVPYSLLSRAVEFEIVPDCRNAEIGLLAYSPLMQGLLTGKFASPDEVPEPRARSRHFSSERPMARHGEPGCEHLTFATIDRIQVLADEAGFPMEALALAWLLEQPAVSSLVVGARDPDQLRKNREALEISPEPPLLEALSSCTDGLKLALGDNPDLWQTSGRIQ